MHAVVVAESRMVCADWALLSTGSVRPDADALLPVRQTRPASASTLGEINTRCHSQLSTGDQKAGRATDQGHAPRGDMSQDGSETETSEQSSQTHLTASQWSVTSAATSSSQRSIASTFSALNQSDIAFFDHLVSTLAPGASSFKALRDAYEALKPQYEQLDGGKRDDHRWTILLALTKILGSDWNEKWDTVRMGLGLDLRDSDDTMLSSAFDRNDSRPLESADEDTEQLTSSEWTQEASQSEGSNADDSDQSTVSSLSHFRHGEDRSTDRATGPSMASSPHSSSSTATAVRGTLTRNNPGSPPRDAMSSHKIAEFAALQARMESLSRLTSQLALQARQTTPDRPLSFVTAQARQNVSKSQDTSLETRLSRLLDLGRSPSPSSDSDVERAGRRQKIDRSHSLPQKSGPSLWEAAQRRAEESEEAAWARSANLAQRTYDARVLLRSWIRWRHRSIQQKRLETNVAHIHDTLQRRRAFEAWRSLALAQPELEETAIRANAVRMVLSSWRMWRRKANVKSATKWEAKKTTLRQNYASAKDRHHSSALKAAWATWRHHLESRRATNFRTGHLLGGAFYLWRIKLDVNSTLSTREEAFKLRRSRDITSNVFEAWRREAKLLSLSKRWFAQHDSEDIKNVFESWRRSAALQALARAFAQQRLQRNTLRSWLERLAEASVTKRRQQQADRLQARHRKIRALQRWRLIRSEHAAWSQRADAFREKADGDLLRKVSRDWKLKARQELLSRVSRARQLRQAWVHWQQRVQEVTVTMRRRAEATISRRDGQMVAACLQHWRSRMASQATQFEQADRIAKRNLKVGYLGQWRAVMVRHAEIHARANLADEWFLQKRTWSSMCAIMRLRRLERWQKSKHLQSAQEALQIWRHRAQEHIDDRLRVAAIRNRSNDRIVRDSLRHWTSRVIERRGLELQVSDAYREKLGLMTFTRWRTAYLRVQEISSLGESFSDVKREATLRKNMQAWLYKVRKLRSLQERADRFVREKSEKTSHTTLEKWYEKLREEQLRDAEVVLVTRRQDAAKVWALASWIGKTKPIPALHFHHTRLKTVAMSRWRNALPDAQMRRQALQVDRGSVMSKALGFWLEKAKARKAARAAARFGGPSMGARLRRHSSRIRSPFAARPRRSLGIDESDSRSTTPSRPAVSPADVDHEQGSGEHVGAASMASSSAGSPVQERVPSRTRSTTALPVGRAASPSASTATFSSSRPSRVAQSEYAYPSLSLAQTSRTGGHPSQGGDAAVGAGRERRMSVRSESFVPGSHQFYSSSARKAWAGDDVHSASHSARTEVVARSRRHEPIMARAEQSDSQLTKEKVLEDLRRRRRDIIAEQRQL